MNAHVAIVTGGAGALGHVIAECLLERGWKVVIFDRDDATLKTLSEKFTCMNVDVTDETSVVEAIDKVCNDFGDISLLVNSAGTIMSEPLINITNREHPRHSLALFKENLDINLTSVFLVASVVAEKMVFRRTQGVIVNISSVCACGNRGQSAYSAAKAGVEALTKVWGKELGSFGIRVAAIAPGFIDTDSTARAMSEQKLNEIQLRTPLRRLGRAENVAKAVLAVLDNDFINGAVIPVDGGVML